MDSDVVADEEARFAFLLVEKKKVPGVLVAGCPSFDRISIFRMLVSRLYAISVGRLKILAT